MSTHLRAILMDEAGSEENALEVGVGRRNPISPSLKGQGV